MKSNSKAVFPLRLRVALRGERNTCRNTIGVSISLAAQRNRAAVMKIESA